MIVNLQNFLYIMSQGWQDAVHTLVGQKIGADQARIAKKLSLHIFAIGIFFESLLILILFFGREKIVEALVVGSDVELLILACMGQICAELFFDLMQGLLNSVMKALGFMKTSLIVMLIWFYVIFLPLAHGLAVQGRHGIWLIQSLLAASMCGLSLTFLTILFAVINWRKVAANAYKKMAADQLKYGDTDDTSSPPTSRKFRNRPTSISPLS